MATEHNHHDKVKQQFGAQANAYLTSTVHAQGEDLQKLGHLLINYSDACLLDLGCGAGHVSFLAAQSVHNVTAYDLSDEMLKVVSDTASKRGLENIVTKQGFVEKLPFIDQTFDVVTSRNSLHHWRDVGMALHEAARVLKPGGKLFLIDVVSPGNPVLDIWLQTVEALRDTSHVRDYCASELIRYLGEAGFITDGSYSYRLHLQFDNWVERMRTPQSLITAIREYQISASQETQQYFELRQDGSFISDTLLIEATRKL